MSNFVIKLSKEAIQMKNKKNIMKNYRQGDVYILSTKKKFRGKIEKQFTLALGEVTGHSHVIKPFTNDCKIEVIENQDGCYVRVIGGNAIVEHQEHEQIVVPPGNYEIRIQREYDPISYARRVAD